ncbi:MAG TPA: hypothetical protein DSN98_00520 [Thermoplasmata archaeon]|jgi:hypothetical protein|nr:MAG TPA: hypothetical protein DSN98_00520 [Thermoplasmata archaeon]
MNNRLNKLIQVGVFFIVTIFVVSSASVIASLPSRTPFSSMTKTMVPISGSSKDETELKYYIEENLDTGLDVCGPSVWKSAIRLTQDEIAAYSDWTMTKVNVAFMADHGCPWIDIRIYIFDKGNQTHAGPLIVNDTTYTLDVTGVTTIPLVTLVNLSGHEELWVAVEWYDIGYGPYAWLDTLTAGGAVDGKGDWYYLNNAWGEIQTGGADYDGNWGIGAIIEGAGMAQLAIGNIKGPIGIKANVSNVGGDVANNVQWSITVTGGMLKRVNASAMGTVATLTPATSTPIHLKAFIGFGKISIVITARAENALEITVEKTAFLIGPLVVGIR